MKYIKSYEKAKAKHSNISKMYWALPTDERYLESLRKINVSESLIVFFLNHNQNKYIYISYDSTDIQPWSWMPLFYQEKEGSDWYDSNDYKFYGYINMTEDEIEEFEMKKKIVKYNL